MIEARHQQIVSSALSGKTDMSEARKLIAALIVESQAIERVSREKAGTLTNQEAEDISAELRGIIIDKVITGELYDFDKAQDGTLMGWVMSYARAAKATKTIDIKIANRKTTPFSAHDTRLEDDAAYGSTMELKVAQGASSTLTTHTTDEDELFEASIELLRERRKGLRENGRLFIDASILCMTYQLPRAVRTVDYSDREFVREALSGDRTAAYWALHDYYEIASLEMELTESSYDHRLINVWDSFALDEANLLLSLPSGVAHKIALAASSPKPKPTSRELAKFRSTVRKISSANGWRQLAVKLADSFVASEYEAFSEFHTKSLDALALRDHKRAIEDLPDLLEAAANFTAHPLGVSVTSVRNTLLEISSDVLGNVYEIKEAITNEGTHSQNKEPVRTGAS